VLYNALKRPFQTLLEKRLQQRSVYDFIPSTKFMTVFTNPRTDRGASQTLACAKKYKGFF
jgi:hypothetical protein